MPKPRGNGFDVKALRTIIRLRKQDANERAEQETILEDLHAGAGNAVRKVSCAGLTRASTNLRESIV